MIRLALWAAWLCGTGVVWAVEPKTEIIDFEHEWDREGVIGVPYVLHGRLVAATDLKTVRPIQGATVELVLFKDKVEHRTTARTGADGRVWLRVDTTALTPGTWHKLLHYSYPGGGGGAAASEGIEFRSGTLMRLGTDRPIYEPDQTLRWRLTAIEAATGKPVTGEATIVVKDPHGTQMWRGTQVVHDRGMAIGTLPLGRDARRGQWRIDATLAHETTSTTFGFKQVQLAPFQIRTEPGARPGTIKVKATYPYGEPVDGTLAVQHGAFKGKPLRLEAGEATLDVGTGGNPVQLTVRDGAGREARARFSAPTPESNAPGVAILLEPQVQGRKGFATILTADAQGRLASGKVAVQVGDGPWRTHSTQGAIRVTVPPVEHGWVRARYAGQTTTTRFDARPANAPRVRAIKPIVDVGQPIELGGWWPQPRGQLIATVLLGDAPILQVPVRRNNQGRLRARFSVPQVQGLMQIRVTDSGWWLATDDDDPVQDSVHVYVRPKRLDVQISTDTDRLKLGETVAIRVQTRTATGAALGGVGLAASVVDTRLLALGPLPPALMKTFHTLGVEQARAVGLAFADLVVRDDRVARKASRGLLHTLPESHPEPTRVIPGEDRWHSERARYEYEAYDMVGAAADWPGRLARKVRGQWRFAAPLHRLMKGRLRRDAWDRPVTWAYVKALELDYRFATHVRSILDTRLDLLRSAFFDHPGLDLALMEGEPFRHQLPDHLVRDPWGRLFAWETGANCRYTRPCDVAVISLGPDGVRGTADDVVRKQFFSMSGYGMGALGARRARVARVVAGRPMVTGSRRSFDSTGPAVRKNFEGTVLWSIGQRTDAQGGARFDVPLSDRITGWQIDVEAVSADGAVGHASRVIETFLPRFADVQLPSALAVGDRYTAHAVLTNHGEPAELRLQVETADGLSLDRPIEATMRLKTGEARRIAVPLRAAQAGQGTVRLTLEADSEAVDRVERTVHIEPPGSAMAKRVARRVDGADRFEFSVPEDAESPSATLRVFRSPTDVLLDGLDVLLRAPHGCFEQTSSTTYPNLLVLDLLQDQPGLAAVQAKARRFVALGYQRLVSYEVSGGGFSWFGEAPANQVLTAYGLLEFADMGKVYPVDPDLLVRTRKWLLDQQKPDGSWAPDAQWLHDWSAAQEGAQATTAWIAWALAEAGTQDESLDRALVWLEQRVPDLTPFQLGLLAGAQTRLKRAPTAVSALAKHTQNGRVQAGQSLFSRSPVSADVQATALANQAWVRTGDTRAADAALDWIWQQRQSAGWGNTQATVLALRAALAHRSAPPPKGATIALSLDGEAPSALTLDGTDVPARTWTIQPGTHALALRGPAAALRADLDVRWRSPRPPGTPVVLGLSVQVDRPEKSMAVGQSEVFTVRLHNPGKHTVPMPTVEVPVPPGFRVDMAHFPPTGVARAEDQGDRVVFYLKRLAPDARASIDFQLQALAEVDVLHRPAQVYAYYDPEIRGQSAAARLQARVPQPVARLPARPRLNAVQLGVGSAGRPQ